MVRELRLSRANRTRAHGVKVDVEAANSRTSTPQPLITETRWYQRQWAPRSRFVQALDWNDACSTIWIANALTICPTVIVFPDNTDDITHGHFKLIQQRGNVRPYDWERIMRDDGRRCDSGRTLRRQSSRHCHGHGQNRRWRWCRMSGRNWRARGRRWNSI